MSNPESKSIVELTGSVTKDQAVALLLGWSVDPKRSAYVKLDRFGIPDDQFRTLPSMGQSVQEILTEQLQAAENFGEFAVSIDNYKDADEAGAKIEHWKAKITEAQGYLRAIAAELSLGKDSQLKYATSDTVSDDRLLITLDSLDRWAGKVYWYSVKTGKSIGKKRLFTDDTSEADHYGPDKVRNLMVTLALMVERYAALGAPYAKEGGSKSPSDGKSLLDPSCNALAKEVARHAVDCYGALTIEAQDEQTIRKLLRAAMEVLKNRSQ
jgi:hypothetical protein